MSKTAIESTTQLFLDIYDITSDVMILKNGSTSMVLTVNAMNFGLLAEPEQDAIMYAYARLLNSLNYPVQIVIRSQTKDVTSYLHLLEDEENKSTDPLKKNWINKYRHFVSELIKERNVLDKKFYVVISASALEMGLLPPSTVIPGVKQPDLSTIERSVILDKAKEILEPRRDHMLSQLARIGLAGRQLNTQEIIQLFYLSYNPEAAEGQQITDTNSYTTPLVEAKLQGGFMDATNPNPGTPAGDTAPPALDTKIPQTGGVAPITPADPNAALPTDPATAAPMTPMATTTDATNPSATTTPAPITPIAPSPATGIPVTPPADLNAAPATPVPGAGAPPTITPPPVTGVTPAAGSPPPATPPAGDLNAQNEINSTLQQLGGAPGAASPATPAPSGPAVPPTTPPPSTSAPNSTPTNEADSSKPASDGAKDVKDDLPPLPEI
jgi:hypothetical protein